MPGEPAYRLFRVRVRAVTRLTPSFVRVTFTGAELDRFADHGDDQRINLVLPQPGGELLEPPAGPRPSRQDSHSPDSSDSPDSPDLPDGWYAHWLALPDGRRNLLRTYTVRRARPQQREVDVDFVLHGDGGPASRWAGTAAVGDHAQLVGPNVHHPGPNRAAGWNPPAGLATVLIAGDETALPAIASILEGLPATTSGTVLVEVPEPGDVQPLAGPAGVRVEWLVRAGGGHGLLLAAAVRRAAAGLLTGVRAPGPVDVLDAEVPDAEVPDADGGDLWEVPDQAAAAPVYAWLAGEAGCIAGLRRHLVSELGVDRRSVAFMGYWRAGH